MNLISAEKSNSSLWLENLRSPNEEAVMASDANFMCTRKNTLKCSENRNSAD